MVTTPAGAPDDAILAYDHADCPAADAVERALQDVHFSCTAGECVFVRLPDRLTSLPLIDTALGLRSPTSGTVRFRGMDWASLSPAAAARCRGSIGCVRRTPRWISNLDVDENITLAARHHSRRPAGAILQEAAQLARAFGLPALPQERPDACPASRLRRAEWVRAFMGSPRLLLLEQPADGVEAQAAAILEDRVLAACAAGCAVLWLDHERRALDAMGSRVVQCFTAAAGRLVPEGAITT